MGSIVTIDPVNSIDGHLKVDLEISDGKVMDAWTSGQMYRGIEEILIGKDAREAWLYAQRVCGSCSTTNAITSVRAVENALKLDIPLNAQMIRNMIIAANTIQDHLRHFYVQSIFDWVDLTKIRNANPKKAAAFAQSVSDWPGNSTHELSNVKERIVAALDSGQNGVFTSGYWGHSEMTLDSDTCLIIMAHYFQALKFQRAISGCVGMLGGKTPHIQNLVVGGVANAINFDDETALNMTRLHKVRYYLESTKTFINQVYLSDVCIIGANYLEWARLGAGVLNYLAVPEFPLNTSGTRFGMSGGIIQDSKIGATTPIPNQKDRSLINSVSESIARSWYDGNGQDTPHKNNTEPHYSGYYPSEKYSWVKAPRLMDKPSQTGPLAQVLVSFALGDERTRAYIDKTIESIKTISGKKISLANLHSTIGRHVARAIQTAVINDNAIDYWQTLADNMSKGDMDNINYPTFPKDTIRGFGCHESANGFTSHWVIIENGKINNYQILTSSTWNLSPRDGNGVMGPMESSLIGTPISDPENPLEALRTIHSFGPCLNCATH